VQSANSQAAHGSLAAARGTQVPIDRAAILKNADKLLKQGKLQPAIAEYVRIVEDQPRDFNSVNLLGDLYVRAKQIDRAVEQFVRIADAGHFVPWEAPDQVAAALAPFLAETSAARAAPA